MRRLLILLVKGYRLLLSPSVGNACRFTPTCSVYSIGALERHGALWGSYLTVHRIVRCNPWCEGGHDPVPAQRPRLFSRLLASSKSQSDAAAPPTEVRSGDGAPEGPNPPHNAPFAGNGPAEKSSTRTESSS